MVPVIAGRTPVAAKVIAILRLVSVVIGIGTALGPGIGNVNQTALREPLAELHLKRVVNEVCAGVVFVDVGVTGIGPQSVDVDTGVGLKGSGPELVDVLLIRKVRSAGADIRHIQQGVAAHFLLNAETPVHRARCLQIQVMRIIDGAGEVLHRAAAWILDVAVIDKCLLHKRRVVDGAEDVVSFDPFMEDAVAAAHDRALMTGQIIGEA